MCRQAWFPPGTATNAAAVAEFFAALEKSCGGHGNGAGYVDLADGSYDSKKGEKLSTDECAAIVAARPATSWGVFHTRLASAGGRNDAGCHPHVYESQQKDATKRRLVFLTHNGTWMSWKTACWFLRAKYPSDSATIAALVTMHGFTRVAPFVDETIIAAIREEGKWRIRAWRDHYPLVLLANGGIASEGGKGEFAAKAALRSGAHALTGKKAAPRTEPLVEPIQRAPDGRFVSSHEAPLWSGIPGISGSYYQQAQRGDARGSGYDSYKSALDGGTDGGPVVDADAVADAAVDVEWEEYLEKRATDGEVGEGPGEWRYLKLANGKWGQVWKPDPKVDDGLLPGCVKVDPKRN